MKRHALALFILAGCGETNSPVGDGGVTDGGTLTAQQKEWLTAHNAARAAATPTPNPALPEVEWSANAATLAEEWAARCEFTHRSPNSLGENIFASTSPRTPTAIVNGWADEKANYTLTTNTCAAGKVCGHYTQIVWRSSVGVGCAQKLCTTNSPFSGGTWYLVVCDYEPAGNISGQSPY